MARMGPMMPSTMPKVTPTCLDEYSWAPVGENGFLGGAQGPACCGMEILPGARESCVRGAVRLERGYVWKNFHSTNDYTRRRKR